MALYIYICTQQGIIKNQETDSRLLVMHIQFFVTNEELLFNRVMIIMRQSRMHTLIHAST